MAFRLYHEGLAAAHRRRDATFTHTQNYTIPAGFDAIRTIALDGSIRVVNDLAVNVASTDWTLVSDFSASGPTDEHVVCMENTDTGITSLIFGDDTKGKLPTTGQAVVITWTAGELDGFLQGPELEIATAKAMIRSFPTLVDPFRCPVAHLPLLAHLIGWNLDKLPFEGFAERKQRAIVANAVQVYKLKGSIEGMIYLSRLLFDVEIYVLDWWTHEAYRCGHDNNDYDSVDYLTEHPSATYGLDDDMADYSGVFGLQNAPRALIGRDKPSAVLTDLTYSAHQVGVIDIPMRFTPNSDPAGDPLDGHNGEYRLLFEYSTNGGFSWEPATVTDFTYSAATEGRQIVFEAVDQPHFWEFDVADPITDSSGGTKHSIEWDAVSDGLGDTLLDQGVRFRVSVFDTEGFIDNYNQTGTPLFGTGSILPTAASGYQTLSVNNTGEDDPTKRVIPIMGYRTCAPSGSLVDSVWTLGKTRVGRHVLAPLTSSFTRAGIYHFSVIPLLDIFDGLSESQIIELKTRIGRAIDWAKPAHTHWSWADNSDFTATEFWELSVSALGKDTILA